MISHYRNFEAWEASAASRVRTHFKHRWRKPVLEATADLREFGSVAMISTQ
jgi:hypothetical protein